MIQRGKQLRLTLKPSQAIRIGGEHIREDLLNTQNWNSGQSPAAGHGMPDKTFGSEYLKWLRRATSRDKREPCQLDLAFVFLNNPTTHAPATRRAPGPL
jgi:hypothetical protein